MESEKRTNKPIPFVEIYPRFKSKNLSEKFQSCVGEHHHHFPCEHYPDAASVVTLIEVSKEFSLSVWSKDGTS